MIDINKLVTPKTVGEYWETTRRETGEYLGEALFPNDITPDLTLSWIVGADQSPVELSPTTLNANTIPLTLEGFEKMEAEIPAFRNSYDIDAVAIKELAVIDASAQEQVKVKIARVFDRATKLIANARLTREKLRMQLVTTGAISIQGNGVNATYNYNLPANHTGLTPVGAKWTDTTNADPIADLIAWKEVITEDTGEAPAVVLMNSKTFGYITGNARVSKAIYVMANGGVIPDDDQVKQLIMKKVGLTVVVYDKGYKAMQSDGTKQFVKFVPDGSVTLMPEGELGRTWHTPSPEEILLSQKADANLRVVDTGIALYESIKDDGVMHRIIASMMCLPSFEKSNLVAIADVD